MKLLGAENSDAVQELLIEQFGATENSIGGPPVIAVDRHLELAKKLRDEYQYRIFGFVVAAHYPAPAKDANGVGELIRVSYGLRSVGKGTKLATWQVCIPVDGAIPTLVPLFAGADWQEREVYDLLGIVFEGHPNLTKILTPDFIQGHPLRKDYVHVPDRFD